MNIDRCKVSKLPMSNKDLSPNKNKDNSIVESEFLDICATRELLSNTIISLSLKEKERELHNGSLNTPQITRYLQKRNAFNSVRFNNQLISIVKANLKGFASNKLDPIQCYHQTLKTIKKFMMTQYEVVYFTLYIEKLGSSENFDSDFLEFIEYIAYSIKIYLNVNIEEITEYIRFTNPSFETEYYQFLQRHANIIQSINITPAEVNAKSSSLQISADSLVPQEKSYMNYNLIVEKILEIDNIGLNGQEETQSKHLSKKRANMENHRYKHQDKDNNIANDIKQAILNNSNKKNISCKEELDTSMGLNLQLSEAEFQSLQWIIKDISTDSLNLAEKMKKHIHSSKYSKFILMIIAIETGTPRKSSFPTFNNSYISTNLHSESLSQNYRSAMNQIEKADSLINANYGDCNKETNIEEREIEINLKLETFKNLYVSSKSKTDNIKKDNKSTLQNSIFTKK